MTDQTQTLAAGTAEKGAVIAAALFAIALGLFTVYGTGLVGASTLHNAAHDSRHAFAFPCH